jgi:hypothetical protein
VEAVAVRLDVGLVVRLLAVLAAMAGAMPRAVRLDVRLVVRLLAVIRAMHAMAVSLDVGLVVVVAVTAVALKLLGHGLLLLVRSAKPVHMTATGTEIFPQV